MIFAANNHSVFTLQKFVCGILFMCFIWFLNGLVLVYSFIISIQINVNWCNKSKAQYLQLVLWIIGWTSSFATMSFVFRGSRGDIESGFSEYVPERTLMVCLVRVNVSLCVHNWTVILMLFFSFLSAGSSSSTS